MMTTRMSIEELEKGLDELMFIETPVFEALLTKLEKVIENSR